MARGDSGRIVLEIDPALKRRIYSVLSSDGMTLKDWFVSSMTAYVEDHEQMGLWPKTNPTSSAQKVNPDGSIGNETR
jgi:hypothetical protein